MLGPENPRPLYPRIEPYQTQMLRVSERHEIYLEECGNPDGKPVIFIHGGPGGGCAPDCRRLFDPAAYRIVLFDQRGCGRSRPHAELIDNTTWHLVADIEAIRENLGIDRWQVFGGSWGSTLGLAYAETHPERVTELILRGIFTLRRSELIWFYQEGASNVFPDAWEKFLAPIPVDERGNLMEAYYKRLTGDDEAARLEAAKAWSSWEGSSISLYPDDSRVSAFGEDKYATAFARIECHYFVNSGFFEHDDQLIANVGRLRHIPGIIIQGRYDMCTPMRTAWDLHKAWPEADFHLIPDAGHAFTEPGIRDALVAATDHFSGRN
jgi:proline iminopeptidase